MGFSRFYLRFVGGGREGLELVEEQYSTEIAINIMGKNIRPLMYELPRDFLLA